jgi:hypothetical protein
MQLLLTVMFVLEIMGGLICMGDLFSRKGPLGAKVIRLLFVVICTLITAYAWPKAE